MDINNIADGHIATRNGVNTIVSGAYSDNLNKCVIVSEINSNAFVQIVASQVSLYSDATKCVQFSHIQSAVKTLSSIAISPDPIVKVSGQTSPIVVWAIYSDNTSTDVTSSCTCSITNQSVNGTASWNSSSKTIQHGVAGTATFNASYTEEGITRTDSVSITTQPVIPSSIVLNPDTATVGVGRSTTVSASISLSNGSSVTSGISIDYVNNGDSYIDASINGNTITITGESITIEDEQPLLLIEGTYNGVTINRQMNITVVEAPTLDHISASSTSVTGYNGGSTPVTITAYYSDGTSADVTTSTTGTSTNASYAAWNASGKRVQHNGTGSATITISYTEGMITRTCVISATTKTNGISHITVSSSSNGLTSGGTANITVTQVMLNGATSDVTSGATITCNNNYGSISKSGSTCTFTASSGSGLSTITATFSGKTASCIITVGSPRIYVRSEIYISDNSTAYLRIYYRTGIGSITMYTDVSNYTWEVTSGPNEGHSYDGCKGTGPITTTTGSSYDWGFVFYITNNTTYWNGLGYYQGTNGTTLGAQNKLRMSTSWLPN